MSKKIEDESVHHPTHYGGEDNPYEAIKVIESWGAGFNVGNALKYISRAEHKGTPVKDYQKACWYLLRELALKEDRDPGFYNSLIKLGRETGATKVKFGSPPPGAKKVGSADFKLSEQDQGFWTREGRKERLYDTAPFDPADNPPPVGAPEVFKNFKSFDPQKSEPVKEVGRPFKVSKNFKSFKGTPPRCVAGAHVWGDNPTTSTKCLLCGLAPGGAGVTHACDHCGEALTSENEGHLSFDGQEFKGAIHFKCEGKPIPESKSVTILGKPVEITELQEFKVTINRHAPDLDDISKDFYAAEELEGVYRREPESKLLAQVLNLLKVLRSNGDLMGSQQLLDDTIAKVEAARTPILSEQIDKLANWIMANVPGEPSQNEGAVDTAIRIMDEFQNTSSDMQHRAQVYSLEQGLKKANENLKRAETRVRDLELRVVEEGAKAHRIDLAAQDLKNRLKLALGDHGFELNEDDGGDYAATVRRVIKRFKDKLVYRRDETLLEASKIVEEHYGKASGAAAKILDRGSDVIRVRPIKSLTEGLSETATKWHPVLSKFGVEAASFEAAAQALEENHQVHRNAAAAEAQVKKDMLDDMMRLKEALEQEKQEKADLLTSAATLGKVEQALEGLYTSNLRADELVETLIEDVKIGNQRAEFLQERLHNANLPSVCRAGKCDHKRFGGKCYATCLYCPANALEGEVVCGSHESIYRSEVGRVTNIRRHAVPADQRHHDEISHVQRCGRCLTLVPASTFMHDCAGEGLEPAHYVRRLEDQIDELGAGLTRLGVEPEGREDGVAAALRLLEDWHPTKTEHFQRVEAMMSGFGQVVCQTPAGCDPRDEDTRILRARLILEEALETIQDGLRVDMIVDSVELNYPDVVFRAMDGPADLVELADGCADVSVVTIGTLVSYGIHDKPLLEEVDGNNLLKLKNATKDEFGKYCKSPDHPPPDVKGVIQRLSALTPPPVAASGKEPF